MNITVNGTYHYIVVAYSTYGSVSSNEINITVLLSSNDTIEGTKKGDGKSVDEPRGIFGNLSSPGMMLLVGIGMGLGIMALISYLRGRSTKVSAKEREELEEFLQKNVKEPKKKLKKDKSPS